MKLTFPILIAVILFVNVNLKAQEVNVKVVYNNTADMKNTEATISDLVKSVNTQKLVDALNSNGHISDKNLKITVGFFDRGMIGQMHLKADHELTPEVYVNKWKGSVVQTSSVLFLFCKNKGTSTYVFNKMVVSPQLEKEHLFPLVTQFINKHLSGDEKTIISDGTRYLANAIKPVWNVDIDDTRDITGQAQNLINNYPKYWGNRINIEFDFSFFDLRPATTEDTKNLKFGFYC